MLRAILVTILMVVLSPAFFTERRADRHISLCELVSPNNPLAKQDLNFDARFARTALNYVLNGDPELLQALAAMPAARHLLNHARQFDYDVPKESALSLVRYLLTPSSRLEAQAVGVERSIAFFTGPLLDDPNWVQDVLDYLPKGFRFHGSLFLTFGYDIGVALAPNASLNGAHRHFAEKPRELLYYAIHELHHVGVFTYQKPPRVADIKTCADILRLVDYSTELEGLAVLAARPRRVMENALQDDPDYVALEDPVQMRALEKRFNEQYRYLQNRGNEVADKDAFAVITRMSSGDRLWYRVGAMMASRIENKLGRAALLEIIARNHPTLVFTYRQLFPEEP
jgi:hypothetical protein